MAGFRSLASESLGTVDVTLTAPSEEGGGWVASLGSDYACQSVSFSDSDVVIRALVLKALGG